MCIFLILLPFLATGCKKDAAAPPPKVVLYTSIDEDVARPIIDEFRRKTGIEVILVPDTEVGKNVTLSQRLEAEKDNPQADVWWGNEPFFGINLAAQGILQPYDSPSASDVPAIYRDPQKYWAAVGLRERVLAVTDAKPGGPLVAGVKGLADLTRPEFKGKICMAKPVGGTTAGHIAALYAVMGDEKARQFLRDLKKNDIQLLGGNSDVVRYVATGQIWLGLTDNDDVYNAIHNPAPGGGKLYMKAPDQDDAGMGTLMVPTTVSLIAKAPHAEPAKKLIDYLLSAEVEKKLIDAHFALYSVRGGSGNLVKPMQVDYPAVGARLNQTREEAMKILEGRE